MSELTVRQAANHMWSLVTDELNGVQGARAEFKQNMNFLAICGPSLGKSWSRVAEQMEQDSESQKKGTPLLPEVILTKSGNVPVGITFQKAEPENPLERLNPFRITGTTHYLDRHSTGAMLQPLSPDSKESCRIMDPQRSKHRAPSGTPRG